MYLSSIKLWNFRKFGSLGNIDLENPNLGLSFTPGLNVLIGENDSGKTAILEAIKLVLKTHAYERLFLETEDFFVGSNELRIELIIKGMSVSEASHFTEWLGWDKDHPDHPILRLIYTARIIDDHVIPMDVRAGMDVSGSPLDGQAREYLKLTFLKPLRDAENELIAKKYSRLSQILVGHELFKKGAAGKDAFEGYVKDANESIKEWFKNDVKEDGQKSIKDQIKGVIDGFLGSFVSPDSESTFTISGSNIKDILEKLSLHLDGITNPGLGTMNRLYMAAELLHLQKSTWNGLRLCLVEEEEAHLHPQAQMKVLEAIQQQEGTQFIITTHSPNLASKVKLSEDEQNQVVICKEGKVFPMGPSFTLLDKKDYLYLNHFLDVTKANLFFAKGIILVEGWAEEIILPSIAKKLKKSFTAKEISIVNVGSTAYMRYAKIFMRQNQEHMGCQVSIVTDLDVRPNDENGEFDAAEEDAKRREIKSKVDVTNYPEIGWFIAEQWTLEWCLFQSAKLGNLFRQAVNNSHPRIDGFKKVADGDLFNEENFKNELINRLRKYKIDEDGKHIKQDPIDKVEVAYNLAQLIDNTDIDLSNMGGDTAKYLVDAIIHVCR
jgi:putative ATP-dependent endonuclease of OLD family